MVQNTQLVPEEENKGVLVLTLLYSGKSVSAYSSIVRSATGFTGLNNLS